MTIVFVHGGVSGVAKETPSLEPFASAGASAPDRLDAVVLAVMALEDDPRFNAGYGSVLSIDGGLEMDAGLACGASGGAGGVANVRVRHPIVLARRVLEETPHVLMTGTGAAALGRDLEQLEDTSPEERERWEAARREGSLTPKSYGSPEHVDTVGAVALDAMGRLAAGSSTGGVFAKLRGRVGDAPIFGAGLYASSDAAAVGTGVGEAFLEGLAAARVGWLIERGAAPQEACEELVQLIARTSTATAGLLALDRRGEVGAAYRGGSWAVAGASGPLEAVRLV